MYIGVLKEIKDNENRVALIPSTVKKLAKQKHIVYVQKSAGINSGYSDEEYKKAGAALLSTPEEIVKKSDLIIKVKEPIPKEYHLLDKFKGKILFTYLHLAAADKELTLRLLKKNITGIAYETVETNGALPLLKPMSEVAGVLAIQYAAQYLQKKYQGLGVTLGQIENTEPAKVVVIGGGTAGFTAAKTAANLGCSVVILQRKGQRLKFLKRFFKKQKNVKILESKPRKIKKEVKTASTIIGSVLLPGEKAPRVVTEEMIKNMQNGSVIIDISIDQGGCIWGSKPTTHSSPIYVKEGKIYCCITNMPGQVSRQSTQALTAATEPYLLELANKGILRALAENTALQKGINTMSGKIHHKGVAEALNLMKSYQKEKEKN